jgi:YNFM family putative membrane transporter
LFFYYMGASIAGSVGGIFWSAYAWMGVATFLIALQVVAFGLTVARLSDKSG